MARQILVLDSSTSMRRIIRTMILANINDAEVAEAHDAPEAMEIIQEKAVHLVLFSKESSSPEWLAFVAENRQERGNVHFVLFTSSRQENALDEARKAGVSEHFFIPCQPEVLTDLVTRLCSPMSLRATKRFYIPDAFAVIEQGENRFKAAIINFSEGGLFCETSFKAEYNWTAPTMINLNFSLEGESVQAGGLYSVTSRLIVVESNSDFSPRRIRIAFRFINVPDETRAAFDKVFAYAEQLQMMQENSR